MEDALRNRSLAALSMVNVQKRFGDLSVLTCRLALLLNGHGGNMMALSALLAELSTELELPIALRPTGS